MTRQANKRLMGFRLAGLALILASVFLIWFNQRGRRAVDFWSFQVDTTADIYALPGTWTDQRGQTRALSDFRGQVAVFSFVYTRCKTACPVLMAELKAFERELGERAGEVRFLTFLLDEPTPGPEAKQAFLDQYGIAEPNWLVLSATPEVLAELTDELRVVYQETRNGEEPVFMHTNLIGILGPDGKVAKLDYGWKTETLVMVNQILKTLAKG